MGCIAVAHHVRRDMAGTAHAHCHAAAFLDLTLPQPAAVLIGKQGLLALFGNTHRQIITQCRNAFSHQRHLPLLAAFTLTLTQPSSKTIPSRFKPCISLRRKPLPYINSNMALSRTSNSSSTGAWSRIWFKGSCGKALGRRSGRRGAFILNVGSLSHKLLSAPANCNTAATPTISAPSYFRLSPFATAFSIPPQNHGASAGRFSDYRATGASIHSNRADKRKRYAATYLVAARFQIAFKMKRKI